MAMRNNRGQRGVALITAVLVTALAAVIAVALAARQQVDIRRTGNVLELEQAYQYAKGVEIMALQVLKLDWDNTNTRSQDWLGKEELWTNPLPPTEIEGGQLAGLIEDMSGRFNINSLLDGEGNVDNLALERFKNLLTVVGLQPDLANAVLDWIDTNSDGGAEDGLYLGLEIPYRTANALMASTSELLLVQGFDLESYRKLAPFVVALPESGTKINVNTAPKEVLASLANGLTLNDVESLAQPTESANKHNTVNDFMTKPALNSRVKEGGLAVTSDYFMATADVQIGRTTVRMSSLIYRKQDGTLWTKMRARGAY